MRFGRGERIWTSDRWVMRLSEKVSEYLIFRPGVRFYKLIDDRAAFYLVQ